MTIKNIVSIEIQLDKLVNACSQSELYELIMLADKRLRQMEYQQNAEKLTLLKS